MPEPNLRSEFEQAGLLRGDDGIDRNADPRGRPPQQGDVAGRVGRRDEHQLTGRRRELSDAPDEPPLDTPGERGGVDGADSEGELRRIQVMRQFEQRERVPAGFGNDSAAHARIERPRDR